MQYLFGMHPVLEAVKAGKSLAAEKDLPLICLGSLYMYKEIADNI